MMSRKRMLEGEDLQRNAHGPNTDNLHNLFAIGLPDVVFHTVDKPVRCPGANHHPFRLLEDLFDQLHWADRLNNNSLLLTCLSSRRSDYRYTNEAVIPPLIGMLLTDIISALGIVDDVDVRVEVGFKKVAGFRRSDFLLVVGRAAHPVMITEAKVSGTLNALHHVASNDEMFDRMVDSISYYGRQHVIGVTTTMKHFQLHWFPHSDDYVAASCAPPTSTPAVQPVSVDTSAIALARELHHSQLMRHDDPDLLPILASAVLKCLRSPCFPVAAIDATRAYMYATATECHWSRLEGDVERALTANLSASSALSVGFYVVKYLVRTAERNVWLVLSRAHREMFVAKLLDDRVGAEEEAALWRRVNDCTAFTTEMHSYRAVCAPLVITAHHDRSTRRVWFDFDISQWVTQPGVAAQALPSRLSTFQEQIRALGAGLDPRTVAELAIQRTAAKRVQHDDLAWRHVALLPVFEPGSSEKVVELRPVLIDFGRVTTDVEVAVATEVMMAKFREMVEECAWE
jgi:hypothetical protein